jgi:hypothetical protein
MTAHMAGLSLDLLYEYIVLLGSIYQSLPLLNLFPIPAVVPPPLQEM